MRAKDVMTSPVLTVAPAAPVEEAVALLTSHGVTALPVVTEAGDLVGMVSEGDLLRHRVPVDRTAHMLAPPSPALDRPASVAEAMTPAPITTWPGADLADIAEAMLAGDVRSIPVLDDGAVVGIVSRRDILRAMVRTDEALAAEVQHRLDEYAPRWTATVKAGAATVTGPFGDDTERAVVTALTRTVAGVVAVHLEG
ncbi:CBS domain-containing protein [Paractinoplanes atraurantiacus]|uniref:CBS domain-containing protein n=1 Tax=Paractinoplanes atraurantiacus TaxID=1036182 RepID=A0A285JIB4_9ACTN|nr:CBS domain-containing protein [Actinoplanes atraurantiacus]SNY59998.1 CBS domain-containing protein [Actinoplanes atraurantiacus]